MDRIRENLIHIQPHESFQHLVDDSALNVTFVGIAKDKTTTESDKKWIIWAEFIGSDGVKRIQYANRTPAYSYSWTDRATYFSPSDFTAAANGGRTTVVAIDNVTWTPLPATPLAFRRVMSVQNRSGQEIKLNFDPATVGYVGTTVDNLTDRFYDSGLIIMYAKSLTGACSVVVEEIT